MPFTNTVGSNTIEGYRNLGQSADTDTHWNDVILLLQPQSSDSNSFDDKSQYNFTQSIKASGTRTGTSSGGSWTKPSLETAPGGNKWSNSNTINFNGSTDIITADYVSNLIANSSSPDTWTIEMWYHIDQLPASGQHLCLIGFHGNTFVTDAANPHVDNHITFWMANAASGASGLHYFSIFEENGAEVTQSDIAPLPAINTWHHMALVNDNKSLSIYLNGTRIVNRTIQTTIRGGIPDTDDGNRDSFQIGADQDSQNTNDFCDMHVAGVRVTRNQARYSGTSYSIPTDPFPLRGPTTTSVGAVSGSPITCENEALRFLDENNTASSPTLAWIQHPRVNGNNPYQAYLIKDKGYAWVLAAKMASSDLNNQIYSGSNVTGTQSGKPAFIWHNRPNHTFGGTVVNDWGTATHTFNHTAYDTTLDKSMRTRIWPELRSKFKRIFVGSYNWADGNASTDGMILYKQNRGRLNENEIGVNQSWGEFIENVTGDGSALGAGQNDNDQDPSTRFGGNNLPADTSHVWPNERDGSNNTLNVAGMKKYDRDWNYDGLDFLYLGASDREQTTATTNDCALISGATTERGPTAFPTCNSNASDDGTNGTGGCNGIVGIGVKRAGVSTTTGFAVEGGTETTPKANNITTTDHNNGNYHGLFGTRVANGHLRTEESARMNFWTRLQGGDGSTIDRAFDGSLMELDSLWYNNSISAGVYWFRSKTLGIVACDVVNRGGTQWIRVPFGNSGVNTGVTLNRTMLMKDSCPALSKFVFNVLDGNGNPLGQATVANMTFDSDGKFGNGDNDSTDTSGQNDHNKNIGWAIWDIGIPFRQLQAEMSFRNHWATGTGGTSADWNPTQIENAWDPKTTHPQYTAGDWPFVVMPDPQNPLTQMIAVNGAGTSSHRTSTAWTTGEQIPAVTQSMELGTTVQIGDVGSGTRQDEHAAEAFRFGVGFAGFGKETYRVEEGYFYIR